VVQQQVNLFDRAMEGVERGDIGQVRRAMNTIGGTMMAGWIANEILSNITNSHKSKYQDYGMDMFHWEIGGVTVGIAKEFAELMSEFVTSYDGTPDERKSSRENMLKFIDNIAFRQLVPFAKQVFGMYEAVTDRAYIMPLYNALARKSITKVERTIPEAIAHAMFSTDPNKSDSVRKHMGQRVKMLQRQALLSKSPIERAYYMLQHARASRISDILDRYKPIDTYRQWQHKLRQRAEFDPAYFYEVLYGQEFGVRLAQRKITEGYF